MGGEREAAIANMEAMGFPRAEIDRAMRAAFFNPDRAVEYLLTVRQAALSPFDMFLPSSRVSQRALFRNRHSRHRLAHQLRHPLLVRTQVLPLLALGETSR